MHGECHITCQVCETGGCFRTLQTPESAKVRKCVGNARSAEKVSLPIGSTPQLFHWHNLTIINNPKQHDAVAESRNKQWYIPSSFPSPSTT